MPTFGFTQGFGVEDDLGDMAKRVKKAAGVADQNIGRGIAQVFSAIERDLREAIREHPAWDSAIADRTSMRNVNGAYEMAVDDEQAMHLETGRDPFTSPTPVIGPLLAQKADEINDGLSAVIRRGVGL